MHALNREVTQWDRPCINIFCDDGKIPISMQIMTAWDDGLIFVTVTRANLKLHSLPLTTLIEFISHLTAQFNFSMHSINQFEMTNCLMYNYKITLEI